MAALLALLIGAMTLVGLAAGFDPLIRWLPSSTSMNPVTAILLITGGAALLAPPRMQRWALPAAAAVMVAGGALKLLQAAIGRPLGFDQLAAMALKHGTVLPDALALNTATAFILLGAALAIGRTRQPSRAIVAQVLVIAAIAIAVMALAGFALDAAAINQMTYNKMAVNTAVALVALGMATITLNADHGVMQLLLTDGPSGDLARNALPICLAAPILLGVFRLSIERGLGFSTGDGVAIMVAGNIALSLGLLWGSLILLLKSDAERRDKALALEISENRYRQASRIGQMGHWHYDVRNDDLQWTNELRALLGLPADLEPGFHEIDALIDPDDREQAQELLRRAVTDGQDWSWQIRITGADGGTRYFNTHGSCQLLPDGTVDSVFGVLADVTELQLARAGAEAASLAQANFLANMSHEIRTPLNGVLGFVDLVLDSDLDATQRRYLVLVRESAQALLKLLNDILDLSKVEAGHMEIEAQATDLRRTIRHAVRLMMPIAEQKAIALSVAIDPDFPAAVVADGGRIRQILLNLLGNALKFTDEGRITVSLGATTDKDGKPLLRLAVADSGVGIPAERKEAVFRAFAQADNSTSRRFGGSGLGLSISRQLSQMMGGSIGLDSTEGVGTTVELLLPLVAASAEEIERARKSAASVPPPGLHGEIGLPESPREEIVPADAASARSILLVEDVAFNRELIGEMLRRLGHRVDFAANGAEAVAMAARLAENPPAWDLILMDIQMPVMNGKDAARAIRASGGAASTIPIVALSANAYPAEIQQSRDAGMDDHVVKPVGFAALREMVETWGALPDPPRELHAAGAA